MKIVNTMIIAVLAKRLQRKSYIWEIMISTSGIVMSEKFKRSDRNY